MTALEYLAVPVRMVADNIWPLTVLLVFLLVLKQIRDDVRPVFRSITTGLAANAQSNATAYAIAIGFGMSASFSAFWDVFNKLDSASLASMSWHQYAALWTKVLNPFIVAVLAYATQNRFAKPDGKTAPPFPVLP